jgi:hypothetical protein
MMNMKLVIKNPCEFFWLRKIQDVDISQCCMKCFPGVSDNRVYHASRNAPTTINIDIDENAGLVPPLAYYLCGLSKGYNYSKNTHIAFNPFPGETLHYEDEQIILDIVGARQIDFKWYVPNPDGAFTQRQRTCRNWIFANYIKDGLPL